MGGSGVLTLTGQQGEVMRESVQASLSWIRAHAGQLGLVGLAPRGSDKDSRRGGSAPEAPDAGAAEASLLRNVDLHVHFPAGAVPKDGPSAGLAVTCALVSLLSGRRVRSDTAMTGEVTLRGHVLPVGGVRQKVGTRLRASVRPCASWRPCASRRPLACPRPPLASPRVPLRPFTPSPPCRSSRRTVRG